MIRIKLAGARPEIDINSLEDIALFHCSNISPIIESKLIFLCLYIHVIPHPKARQCLFNKCPLHHKTKEALLKIILETYTFKKSRESSLKRRE
jgi:hypothetical protein